jgi:DNA-binding NarL/FixJ family response regulator
MAMSLLIVDDHPGFRSFASMMLADEGFDVIGDAADGESALESIERLHPDVVLLDVQLPGIDGFEVARRLAEHAGGPRVVLTSSREASDYGSRLTSSAVTGFVPKTQLSGAALTRLLDPA